MVNHNGSENEAAESKPGQSRSVSMKLGDQDLASLLDEIVHAVRNDVPIVDTMQRLASERMGQLGRVAKKIAEKLESGGSLSDTILMIKSTSAPLVATTVSSAGRSHKNRGLSNSGLGSVNADLLGMLASRIRSRVDAARVSRMMWFYPLILVTIAYAAVLFIVVPLVSDYRFHPTIEPLGIRWPSWLTQIADWLSVFPWIPPVLLIGSIIVGSIRMRRRPTFGTAVRKSAFCHALADQLSHDVPESEAISIASSLSGFPVTDVHGKASANRSPTLDDPPMKQLLSRVGGISETDQLNHAEDSNKESSRLRIAVSAAQLRYLGNLYQFDARRRQRYWSIIIPQVATVLFGLIFMTGYVWFVIGPIYREVAQW